MAHSALEQRIGARPLSCPRRTERRDRSRQGDQRVQDRRRLRRRASPGRAEAVEAWMADTIPDGDGRRRLPPRQLRQVRPFRRRRPGPRRRLRRVRQRSAHRRHLVRARRLRLLPHRRGHHAAPDRGGARQTLPRLFRRRQSAGRPLQGRLPARGPRADGLGFACATTRPAERRPGLAGHGRDRRGSSRRWRPTRARPSPST